MQESTLNTITSSELPPEESVKGGLWTAAILLLLLFITIGAVFHSQPVNSPDTLRQIALRELESMPSFSENQHFLLLQLDQAHAIGMEGLETNGKGVTVSSELTQQYTTEVLGILQEEAHRAGKARLAQEVAALKGAVHN